MMLENISHPADLKKMAQERLPDLCAQIREVIIDTVSKNGGHLAPSLGVVELTTALHYVFDSPHDKIIWDVGHQSYAHKILTGRRDRFHTLRKVGGISGFPKIEESPHDCFGTGHASTSISAAAGIAHALEKRGGANRAIAVIGDGSMTGGLAFESLNQAGHKIGNLIVVLNDNEMSISPNVGALSRFLSIRIHGKTVNKIRRSLKKLLLLIPIWGKKLYRLAQKAEETTVGFLTPGHLFEAFGFHYIGPLDGHNVNELIRVFQGVKDSPIGDKPILIHVLTKKGKGYAPAEDDPTRFHGIGPFDLATGKSLSSGKKTYSAAFGDALLDIAKENYRVVGITAAMTTGTGLERFAREYPDRFFDVGIAEDYAVTFAAGLATQGYRPVVAIYSSFLQRAYDQIIHDVCLQNLPVTFAVDRAGVVGEDGPTHHGTFDISSLRLIPNIVLSAPRNERMLREMFFFATEHNGPVVIRYPRGVVPEEEIYIAPQELQLGRAEIVYQQEHSVATVWAVGHLVEEAVKAAELLNREGINITVVDPRFIKPFDFELFGELAKSCPNIVTVEENALCGGFGSMVNEWLREERFSKVNLKCLGISDQFVEHAHQDLIRARCGIDSDGIVKAVKQQLNLTDSEDEHSLTREFPVTGRAMPSSTTVKIVSETNSSDQNPNDQKGIVIPTKVGIPW